ncbi:MAG TPA: hypothetical protein VGQ53_07005 [Chitinophagaceae bacterium]|jgi:hypothetical protein|nr:hypothetical protein [Chitinophagaceae bacterium]
MKTSVYSELPLWEKLINKVMIYYQTVWSEKKCTSINHKNWLSNFKDEEKLNSLYLLSKFMFFGQDEIRELLVSIFRDKYKYGIVYSIRKNNGDTKDEGFIQMKFDEKLSTTRFVSLGSSSESGSLLLYIFRQVNKLGTRFMKSSAEILNAGKLSEPGINMYIFIDDFCGSGETAIRNAGLIKKIKSLRPDIVIHYYSLFATSEGLKNINDSKLYDKTETIFKLDESFKCFSSNSRYYTDKITDIDKDVTEKFSNSYGLPLVLGTPIEGHPLGFNDGQLLISLSHNTPDNSLPIFWSDKNWFPFFLRYTKIH